VFQASLIGIFLFNSPIFPIIGRFSTLFTMKAKKYDWIENSVKHSKEEQPLLPRIFHFLFFVFRFLKTSKNNMTN